MIVNRVELADVLGCALVTVDVRVKEGMPFVDRPDREKGTREWRFNTADIIQWMVEQVGAGSKEDEMKILNLREKAATAGLKEMELGERQKVLVLVDDVAGLVEEQFAIVKSRLQAIPGRVAQKLSIESDPEVIRRTLTAEVGDALTEISTADVVAKVTV